MAAAIETGVALSFVAAGAVAWLARPHNRTGPLLAAAGLLWMAPVVGGLWAAVFAHVILAFPAGRLIEAAARAAAALAYVSAAVFGLIQLIEPDAAPGAGAAGAIIGGSAVIAVLVSRWRRGTAAQRRLLAPMLAAGTLAAAAFVIGKPALLAGATGVTPLAYAAVPLAMVVTLVRHRIDRAGVADLVVRLGTGAGPAGIERALVETLHDPTLRIAFRIADTDRHVDPTGHETALDGTVTRIDREGEPLAVLIHDRALLDDPELIEAACAAAALALDNARLTAELRAKLREVQQSRELILEAAERERRRLERDLHDGAQQRLLSIPLTLSLAEAAVGDRPDQARPLIAEARNTALDVLRELRAIGQGIHPPILTERGLEAAVRELAALAPLPVTVHAELGARPPAPVETTAYFVAAEALANMTKHARASRGAVRLTTGSGWLRVEVTDDGCGGADETAGSGLRGIAERVAHNGGTLRVDSPPGDGTRVEAVLPCG